MLARSRFFWGPTFDRYQRSDSTSRLAFRCRRVRVAVSAGGAGLGGGVVRPGCPGSPDLVWRCWPAGGAGSVSPRSGLGRLEVRAISCRFAWTRRATGRRGGRGPAPGPGAPVDGAAGQARQAAPPTRDAVRPSAPRPAAATRGTTAPAAKAPSGCHVLAGTLHDTDQHEVCAGPGPVTTPTKAVGPTRNRGRPQKARAPDAK